MLIKELREKLELMDGESELQIMDYIGEVYPIEDVQWYPKEDCFIVKP